MSAASTTAGTAADPRLELELMAERQARALTAELLEAAEKALTALLAAGEPVGYLGSLIATVELDIDNLRLELEGLR